MTPPVSIIIPTYNEVQTISLLLDALGNQTVDQFEVVIADGMSEDGTREAIESSARKYPAMSIRVIDNHQRSIPSALNIAIANSQGEVLIRLDAHSVPDPDYIERCLEVQESTGAANVGGGWSIEPSGTGWIPRSIAAAAAHPLAAGDARYRVGGNAGEVDTVPFGAFHRDWLETVGGFDEGLLTNEDYELNVRLRKSGGVVWFDPRIHSTYLAREDLGGLARQYFRYGFWKAKMLRMHPGSLRWRQALPPLFVWATAILGLLGLYVPLAWTLLAIQWVVYVAVLIGIGILEAIRHREGQLAAGIPLSIATIHQSWSLGFWWGLLSRRKSK